ncbi:MULTISPECIES: PE family protein [unclassified Mycobacterium]|uniref:PE family protein n=1 Tax=unclassified Mycobacterium TaxID=2642494 RepID=UPI002741DFD0|nr:MULTISPECIES: PE family protein [unclassified Mycobacterium]MDP7703646.1 PE family protein [Mycobacterium sp. TY815]MDP7722128.1 PE family protein [Mycobacterium sp. TY814]
MSAVVAVPDLLAQAATQVTSIGGVLESASGTAAASTQALPPAAADEVSAAVAQLFSRFGQDYQYAADQAAAYSQQFVQHLTAAANSYASVEAANVSVLAPAAAGIPTLDQIFSSLVSTVTGLFWQTLSYLYYLGFLLLIPIYAALALWLPVAFLGSLFGLT